MRERPQIDRNYSGFPESMDARKERKPSMKGIAVYLVLLFAAAEPAAGAGSAPQAVVERLHKTLLQAMTEADRLGYEGRYDLIRPIVQDSFDFNTIARIVTGRYWKEIPDDQREKFKDVFSQLSTATYASNFSEYSGERFETIDTEEQGGGYVIKTALVKSDGEKIPFNYLLRGSDNEWLIVNVVAQGVSDLSLKRADYTAVIKNEGFDSLVNRLNDKIASMKRGS
jgi:phospholipid transport system substrate-binding protein